MRLFFFLVVPNAFRIEENVFTVIAVPHLILLLAPCALFKRMKENTLCPSAVLSELSEMDRMRIEMLSCVLFEVVRLGVFSTTLSSRGCLSKPSRVSQKSILPRKR